MTELRKYHVKLGQTARVKKGFLFIGPSTEIVYTGMPNKEVFSLAICSSIMYNSMAHNIFLPLGQREGYAAGGRIEILEVKPDTSLFNYLG